jgi:hypothetical protein
MTQPTGHKSNADLLTGDKLYIERARLTLPILVRQAKAGEPIFYSDLAEEIEMPNPRNLNYVLGAIGNALEALAKREKTEKIPVINCLVVNKSDNLPGEGIGWFIDKKNFEKLSKNQKRETVKRLLSEIYAYPDWDWVLNELGLDSIKTEFAKKFKPHFIKSNRRYGNGGESQQHLDFKNFLAKHPDLFGLNADIDGVTEYELPSMDTIDVLFDNKGDIVGVEAKSIISDSNDILRGLFQCVKYKALIEAEQKVNDLIPNCHVILALEGEFPKELIGIKNQLGIDVIDKIKNKRLLTRGHKT